MSSPAHYLQDMRQTKLLPPRWVKITLLLFPIFILLMLLFFRKLCGVGWLTNFMEWKGAIYKEKENWSCVCARVKCFFEFNWMDECIIGPNYNKCIILASYCEKSWEVCYNLNDSQHYMSCKLGDSWHRRQHKFFIDTLLCRKSVIF